jgi:hypothetical protein
MRARVAPIAIEIVFGERRIRAAKLDQLGSDQQCRLRRGNLGFGDGDRGRRDGFSGRTGNGLVDEVPRTIEEGIRGVDAEFRPPPPPCMDHH